MSNVAKAGAAVGLGYLLFRVLLAAGLLLFWVVKIAVLLPIVLFNLGTGAAQVHVSTSPLPRPARPRPTAPVAAPASAPDLGPASVDTTGDWRQDRETLKRLLAEGKIK